MNKLVGIGVGLAGLSMGGGMLLTGSASASSNNDVGTVPTDPAADFAPCVLVSSAMVDAPEGAITIEGIGEPIDSFDMAAGSTWQSVSVDADGNITTDEGTDADWPAELDASDPSRSLVDTATASGAVTTREPCDTARVS